MTRSEVETTVRSILESALARPIQPGEDVRRIREAGWDSIKHIEVLFMIEEEFGVTFLPDEIAALDSMNGIVERTVARVEGHS